MKTITIQFTIVTLSFFCISIQAQEAVLTSGGNASTANGSVSYSVGQMVYTYANGSNGSASHGVQQAFEISTLGTNDFPEISLQMSVYPNPTTAAISLTISNFSSDKIRYEIFDLSGKQIDANKISSESTQISMEKLASAIYFLKVIEENKILKTFKIIKN